MHISGAPVETRHTLQLCLRKCSSSVGEALLYSGIPVCFWRTGSLKYLGGIKCCAGNNSNGCCRVSQPEAVVGGSSYGANLSKSFTVLVQGDCHYCFGFSHTQHPAPNAQMDCLEKQEDPIKPGLNVWLTFSGREEACSSPAVPRFSLAEVLQCSLARDRGSCVLADGQRAIADETATSLSRPIKAWCRY